MKKTDKFYLNAEIQAIIALFHKKEVYFENTGLLTADIFENSFNREIFVLMEKTIREGKTIDLPGLTSQLRHNDAMERIIQLLEKQEAYSNPRTHILFLNERKKWNGLLRLASKITKAFEEDAELFESINSFQSDLSEIADVRAPKDLEIAVHMEAMQKAIQDASKIKGFTGVPSGIASIDKFTGGFQNGDLIILAARPSMGKTALAVTIARNCGLRYKIPVGIISAEMTAVKLCIRLSAMETGYDSKSIMMGRLNVVEIQSLNSAVDNLSSAPIYIDDTPGIDINQALNTLHYLAVTKDIKLGIIDYLQILGTDSLKKGNREQEVSQMSRLVKKKAKELNIPIILLSQLSRDIEKRGGDMKPKLSDLRESGGIEQDADLVAFLNRPWQYGIEVDENNDSTEGVAEVIIAKGRDIGIGTIGEIEFIEKTTEFRGKEIKFPFMAGNTKGF